MKQSTSRFSLPATITLDDVLAAVRRRFSLREASTTPCLRHYLDSFDWLLYRADTVFYQEIAGAATDLYWEHLDDGGPSHTMAAPEPPRFAHDLPPGRFRDDLDLVLGYRALLPVADVQYQRRVFRVLNDDEKTTARLVVEEEATASNAAPGAPAPLGARVRVLPVKGYADVADSLNRLLHETLALPAHDHPLLFDALDALGHTPDASAKNDVVLDPALRADEALRLILRALLQTIEKNEHGVRAAIDTEFLHDFRVAIRRTRSVLGQLKSILPPDVVAYYGPEFKWLGGVTGPTRDLDVYLLKFETYQTWLPPAIRQDLAPLRDFLVVQQRREHARLVEALDTPRCRALLDGWRAFLDGPTPEPPSPEAERPVLEVASARIWRTYRKVLRDGQAILHNPNARARALHALRIRCKKLRYLLELFRSLYPDEAIQRLIKSLKRLQDNLGDYNDFAVQQKTLQQFALQMMNDGRTQVEAFLAMGRLEAYMENRQQETRHAFAERFTRFARPKNRRRFKALFKGKSG